ncbi:conserved hypothetical protein [Clostridium botulinum C str. Eklund]|nr:conserved hypothetical protein [Clostridium botulinum C str. Eklund]
MSKNELKINFHYGQEDLKNIIKNIVKYTLNSCDTEINKKIFNAIAPDTNKLKSEKG